MYTNLLLEFMLVVGTREKLRSRLLVDARLMVWSMLLVGNRLLLVGSSLGVVYRLQWLVWIGC
jgi:hypothetical protein